MLNLVKAGCGKSARPVWEADGGQRRKVRLLRPDSDKTGEQTRASGRGAGGANYLLGTFTFALCRSPGAPLALSSPASVTVV
jgi:hypothetical protein